MNTDNTNQDNDGTGEPAGTESNNKPLVHHRSRAARLRQEAREKRRLYELSEIRKWFVWAGKPIAAVYREEPSAQPKG
jgi:hypothetical protein